MNDVINRISGKALVVRGNDIDTDRIIPARFLRCVTFDGLGQYAFYDERVDSKGHSKNHVLDDSRWKGNPILVVNSNFGCGSSREHAPQALKDYGMRAIIGESFAEIFAGNCSSIGIVAVTLDQKSVSQIQDIAEQNPESQLDIDIKELIISIDGRHWRADMQEAYRNSMLSGSWDTATVLSESTELIKEVAMSLPYVTSF